MPIWTEEELRAYEERRSKKTPIPVNYIDDSRTPPVLEPGISHEPLGAGEAEEGLGGRVLVRITSVRKRLIDTDNICGKFTTDFCRYCGALDSDAPEQTKIEVQQRKCAPGESEKTIIEIWK